MAAQDRGTVTAIAISHLVVFSLNSVDVKQFVWFKYKKKKDMCRVFLADELCHFKLFWPHFYGILTILIKLKAKKKLKNKNISKA